jgi:hypothetical protein
LVPAAARVEIEQRILADHGLGKRRGQREEHPVPGAIGEPRIHPVPPRPGRHDVEHREPDETSGVVERQSIGDAAAAVVPGHAKTQVAERLHHRDHGVRHGAFGVGRVLGVGPRRVRPAIAGQIR